MNRAYSLLEIKEADDDSRIITGIASTPITDRQGDIVLSNGAVFKLPIPFLWQHNADQPIGHVTKAKVTKNGIEIVAQIAKGVTAEIDRAWSLIKAGLVRGLSIGFRALDVEDIPNSYGVTFVKWEWLELSAVTIAANADANIQTIKSIDDELLASSGRKQSVEPSLPGVSGLQTPKRKVKLMSKTIAEQITSLEATRAAKAARMEEVMQKSIAEGRSTDDAEQEEFDTLSAEVEAIDKDLARLRIVEKTMAATAKPPKGETEKAASQSRGSVYIKTPDLPKGTLFTRYAMAIAAGKGSLSDALQFSKRWDSQTPEVGAYIKAVAGNTGDGSGVASSDADWGAELVYPTNLVSEFIELLRPATIIGRIQGFRRVPFNVRVTGQDTGGTTNWVGEGQVKPVTELSFLTVTLPYHKIAGIVVLTEELIRLSSPSAEERVRMDLVEQIARFMDQQFLDPNVTATDNRPASVTNGVTGNAASGTTADDFYFDMNTALATFDNAEMSDMSLVLLMPRAIARGISGLRNALGQFEFTSMEPTGGTVMGYPVIVSNSVPSGNIVLVSSNDIFLADDGRVTLDASREATLDMAGGGSPNFSLYQRNCVGIRAERWITWKKARATAVERITGAAYGPQASS